MIDPLHASHRSGELAKDLAYIVARYIDTLSQFISKGELFHLQMNTLYMMIDLMGATSNSDPQAVCDEAKAYFKSLEREKGNV
jgi:hypothetical protein